MQNKISTPEAAKDIIRQNIAGGKDFQTLRKMISGLSRKNIKLLVFEVMTEQKISEVPFAGMLDKRKKAVPPLPVTAEGMVDVSALLAEKGFLAGGCVVHYSIGPRKITMTIREKNSSKAYPDA